MGHSARRTGALRYIRHGWAIPQVAYLGRWKSAVIYEYVAEALESLPVNANQSFLADLYGTKGDAQGKWAPDQVHRRMDEIRESLMTEISLASPGPGAESHGLWDRGNEGPCGCQWRTLAPVRPTGTCPRVHLRWLGEQGAGGNTTNPASSSTPRAPGASGARSAWNSREADELEMGRVDII